MVRRVFAVSDLIATQIHVRIFQEGFVALILPLRLFELRLKRARIDLREQVTLFDYLPFAVIDAHQLTIDAAFDSYRVHGRHGAERVDVNADTSCWAMAVEIDTPDGAGGADFAAATVVLCRC